MKVDFAAGVSGRVANTSADKCQNLFPVVDQDSKKPYALVNTPGLSEFCDTGEFGEVRGVQVLGSTLFTVVGNKAFSVSTSGVSTEITGALSTSSGVVRMAANLTQVMIVDGTAGYIIESGDLTAAGVPYPPVDVAFQDGYFICPVSGEDVFYISGLNDGTSWDSLDYGSAEAQPDKAVAVISDHRELWVFGDDTTEPFQNTGDSDFPFVRIDGAHIERGCMAGSTAAKMDNSVFWLDNNGQVVRANGYTPQVVSTRNIEYQIGELSTPTDAHAYTYVQEGYSFYVLIFPTDRKVFVLDVATMQWHTRTSGIMDLRHRGNCCALFANKRIVGDYENGKLYSYDFDTYDENRAIARARVAHPERKMIFHYSLEIEFDSGSALLTEDPQAILRFSDDHGHTWSRELWRSIGKTGEYKNLAQWNKLGRSKDRIYEVIMPGAYRKMIIGATLRAGVAANG